MTKIDKRKKYTGGARIKTSFYLHLLYVTCYDNLMTKSGKKRGRPPVANPLTPAERMRNYRARKRSAGFKSVSSWVPEIPDSATPYSDHCLLKVKSIQLTKDNIDECMEYFSRYLQYEQVKSGHAFDNLRPDHDLVRSANTAKSKIPEAWERLVDEEDLLIEMIVEKVKDVSEGRYAPKKTDVVAFLQNLKAENRPIKTTAASRARPPRRESQTFSGGSNPFYQYKINGEIHQGRNGKDIYIKVLDYIFVTYGRFQELKSHPLNRMKSRSLGTGYHISEDRIEITKEDKHKQQLPGSKIWLNTNQSASSMSGKLIKIGEFYNQLENRKILGVWGSGAEVEFDIPTRPSAS